MYDAGYLCMAGGDHVRDLLGLGVLDHVAVHHVAPREHPVSKLGRREARRELESCEVLVELLAADLVGVRDKGWGYG